jgi:Periplasmic component of the Tol biopolymer transport system
MNQNRISFTSFQKGNYSIFSIDPSGSETTQLTANANHEGWHAWSPDGEWIVFDYSVPDTKGYDIYRMKRDSSNVTRLTDDWRCEQGPVFVKVKKL